MTNGNFVHFAGATLIRHNDLGQVAFQESLQGTSGGFTDDSGLFIGEGTGLSVVLREGAGDA